MIEYAPCPDCGNADIKRVRFTWWGGFLGPLLFKQLNCKECGARFLIKAVRSKLRRVVSWSFRLVLVLAIAAMVYSAQMGPDTKVLPGRQVPARLMARINELVSLEPDERIQFVYSDALFDIADGFYLLTDRRLIIYSSGYQEPAILVPFSEIEEVEAAFSDSWADDTVISVLLADGSYLSFPAAPKGGGDRRMFHALNKAVQTGRSP